MADALIALAVVVAVTVAAVASGVALVLRSLVRANQLTEGQRASAPLAWLWSWRLPARLHRRLQRVTGITELAVGSLGSGATRGRGRRRPPATPLHDVGAELVARAVAIDDCLVVASRLNRHRSRPALVELTAEVADVEAAAYRLHWLCGDWRRAMERATPADPLASADEHERLDAVEAALAELSSPA